jgi:hypothetical protein
MEISAGFQPGYLSIGKSSPAEKRNNGQDEVLSRKYLNVSNGEY